MKKNYIYKVIISCCLLINSLGVSSADTMGVNTMGSYSFEAIKIAFSLVFVLCIFYAGVTLFKKYLSGSFKSDSVIKIVGGLPLGGKEKLVLVEAGSVNLLLGVSPSGIATLHRFSKQELSQVQSENESTLLNFDHHLEKLIGKKTQ